MGVHVTAHGERSRDNFREFSPSTVGSEDQTRPQVPLRSELCWLVGIISYRRKHSGVKRWMVASDSRVISAIEKVGKVRGRGVNVGVPAPRFGLAGQ